MLILRWLDAVDPPIRFSWMRQPRLSPRNYQSTLHAKDFLLPSTPLSVSPADPTAESMEQESARRSDGEKSRPYHHVHSKTALAPMKCPITEADSTEDYLLYYVGGGVFFTLTLDP